MNLFQHATSVAAETRQKSGQKLDLQFHAVKDDYSGSAAVWITEPDEAGCRAILAEKGGKCWVSSVFFLLTGKKSGKKFLFCSVFFSFFEVLGFSDINKRIIIDKRKDAAALRRLRLAIKEVMLTDEFQNWSVKCLGYAANERELAAASKPHGLISEPLVKLLSNIGIS